MIGTTTLDQNGPMKELLHISQSFGTEATPLNVIPGNLHEQIIHETRFFYITFLKITMAIPIRLCFLWPSLIQYYILLESPMRIKLSMNHLPCEYKRYTYSNDIFIMVWHQVTMDLRLLYRRLIVAHAVGLPISWYWCCQREGQGAKEFDVIVAAGIARTKLITAPFYSCRGFYFMSFLFLDQLLFSRLKKTVI